MDIEDKQGTHRWGARGTRAQAALCVVSDPSALHLLPRWVCINLKSTEGLQCTLLCGTYQLVSPRRPSTGGARWQMEPDRCVGRCRLQSTVPAPNVVLSCGKAGPDVLKPVPFAVCSLLRACVRSMLLCVTQFVNQSRASFPHPLPNTSTHTATTWLFRS